jgi:osmotically-inducible protein OsmY
MSELSDEKLQRRVKDVLSHSHDVDPSEIEINVEDSVVYLKGNIRSQGMKVVAQDLVASIPGVLDVFAELHVTDTDNFYLSPTALKEARSTDQS